jgi:hypothetical protein
MSIVQNNAKVILTCGQRLKALNAYVKTKTAMTVDGKPMKLADVTAIYQAAIDTRTALVKHRVTFDKALEARDSAETSRLAIDKGLKAWVATQFGANSQKAQEFGFSPVKVATKSVDTKVQALEKSKATRTARGTRGKKQKQKIKGTVVLASPAEPVVATPAATPLATTNAAPQGASPSNGAAASH